MSLYFNDRTLLLTDDDIHMPMELLSHCYVRLSQEMDAWFEGRLRPAIYSKIDTPTCDHGPTDFVLNYRRSMATYHAAHFRPLFYSKESLLCYSSTTYRYIRCSAHSFYGVWFPGLISRHKRDPLLVPFFLLFRYSGPRYDFLHVFKSCKLLFISFACHYADNISTG